MMSHFIIIGALLVSLCIKTNAATWASYPLNETGFCRSGSWGSTDSSSAVGAASCLAVCEASYSTSNSTLFLVHWIADAEFKENDDRHINYQCTCVTECQEMSTCFGYNTGTTFVDLDVGNLPNSSQCDSPAPSVSPAPTSTFSPTSSPEVGDGGSAPDCLTDCYDQCETDTSTDTCMDDCDVTEACAFLDEYCAGYSFTEVCGTGSCYSSTSTVTRLNGHGQSVTEVPLSQLEVGDRILGLDVLKKPTFVPIDALPHGPAAEAYVHIVMMDKTEKNELQATLHHTFQACTSRRHPNGGMLMAKDLKAGDCLHTAAGRATVHSVQRLNPQKGDVTYSIKMAGGVHTIAVGGVFTHALGGAKDGSGLKMQKKKKTLSKAEKSTGSKKVSSTRFICL